jgi:sugar lactone lactonase YvrE
MSFCSRAGPRQLACCSEKNPVGWQAGRSRASSLDLAATVLTVLLVTGISSMGRLYTCEYQSRRVVRISRDRKIETIADRWKGKRLNAPNDIVIRRDGHIYFTDPLFTPLAERELDFYGVYRISPDGKMDLIAQPKGRPNGIAMSPDGKILYVANTDERNVAPTTSITRARRPTSAY